MSDQRKDYFDYLENVLGIKSIIENSLHKLEAKVPVEVLIVVQDYSSYQAAEVELLEKMISALKLEPSRIVLDDLTQADHYDKKVCVVFRDDPTENFETKAELLVKTYSPRVLLRRSEFKKDAWNELQRVLRFFSGTAKT